MRLSTGDILNVSNPVKWWSIKSWVGWLICRITKSKYNHTAIVVMLWDQPYVAEAKPKGVTIRHWDEWIKGRTYEVMRPSGEIDERALAVRIMSKQGHVGYDFGGLLVWQLIYQLTGHWIGPRDEKRASRRMFCSEYVAWCLGLRGYFLYTPDDISKLEGWT